MILKDFNGKEIQSFNNDEAQVSYYPKSGCKFILQCEEYYSDQSMFDKFFIIHIDENGDEIERWDAISQAVTSIKWLLTNKEKGQ